MPLKISWIFLLRSHSMSFFSFLSKRFLTRADQESGRKISKRQLEKHVQHNNPHLELEKRMGIRNARIKNGKSECGTRNITSKWGESQKSQQQTFQNLGIKIWILQYFSQRFMNLHRNWKKTWSLKSRTWIFFWVWRLSFEFWMNVVWVNIC